MFSSKKSDFAHGYFKGKIPRVIGHRGSSGTHPQNTLISFAQAIEDGADALELDIQLTADHQLVVIHDLLVDSTSDGTGPVAPQTLAQLKQLDAGYRFTADGGNTFPFRGLGITMPTLEEVLQAFPGVPLNIDIKANDEVLVAELFRLLHKYNRLQDVIVQPLIKVKKNALAKLVRSAEPQALTGHSYWELMRFTALCWLGLPFLFKPLGPTIQAPERQNNITVVTPRFVRCAHRLGMEVQVYTVDQEKDMKRLLSMGVDALFTNYPGRMRKLVDSGQWMSPERR